jgi:DNA-binding transcriptional MerR regulator
VIDEQPRYRQAEAAMRIGVSARTLRRYEKRGWIERERSIGQWQYTDEIISKARLMKWALSQEATAVFRESARRRERQKLKE